MPKTNTKSKAKKEANKPFIAAFIAIAVVILVGVGLLIAMLVAGGSPKLSIEYSDQHKSAKIVLQNGQEQEVDVPTVESVDVDKSQTTTTEGEHGLGIWADVSSPEAFKNSTIGRCIDTDNYAGAQCWDISNLFYENYANRTFSTCGTGAAKGALNCWEYNKGDEFEMVWNANDLQPGDIAVFTSGTWGHTGMIMGYANNGYITLLSQNQGGEPCPGGGSSTNIINISLRDFGGAFRPKAYIKPAPAPEPEPIPITGCKDWSVKKYDTMLGIGLACENVLMTMPQVTDYAKTWYSRYYVPGQSVYDGWNSKTGVGLYAGDTIDHKIGE